MQHVWGQDTGPRARRPRRLRYAHVHSLLVCQVRTNREAVPPNSSSCDGRSHLRAFARGRSASTAQLAPDSSDLGFLLRARQQRQDDMPARFGSFLPIRAVLWASLLPRDSAERSQQLLPHLHPLTGTHLSPLSHSGRSGRLSSLPSATRRSVPPSCTASSRLGSSLCALRLFCHSLNSCNDCGCSALRRTSAPSPPALARRSLCGLRLDLPQSSLTPLAMFHLQRFFGTALGKGRQQAKTEIERLKLNELTCRQAVLELGRMCAGPSAARPRSQRHPLPSDSIADAVAIVRVPSTASTRSTTRRTRPSSWSCRGSARRRAGARAGPMPSAEGRGRDDELTDSSLGPTRVPSGAPQGASADACGPRRGCGRGGQAGSRGRRRRLSSGTTEDQPAALGC